MMKTRKWAALLASLVLVCLSLSGCIAEYAVVSKDGEQLYELPGAVPTEGWLVMIVEDYLEQGMVYPESTNPPPTEEEMYRQDLTYEPYGLTQVVFNPIEGGEKVTVGKEFIMANEMRLEEKNTKVLEILVPYTLKPGKYAVTIFDNVDLEPSVLDFKVYANGREIATTSVQRFSGEEEYIEMTVVDSIPTGDASHLVLWAVLAVIGCAGLAVVLMKKRSMR